MDAEGPVTSSRADHARMFTIGSSFQTPPSRCDQCVDREKENMKVGRNLVVCIDGTSNHMGDHNTNVVKLFANIDKISSPEQLVYYSSGIGTSTNMTIRRRVRRAIADWLDMAVAWNIDEIIKETYSWLARTYEEGDQIYLFGFSRGAYQARVLASMIYEIGLIRTPTEKQVNMAYYYYEAIQSGNKEARRMTNIFKSAFPRWTVRVHFVGVWDTVSSIGLVKGNNNFLSASLCAAHACHFRHALALDERRVKFMPEYFHDMNPLTSDVKPKVIFDDSPPACPISKARKMTTSNNRADISTGKNSNKSDIKEVWFAGSHSDVGGVEKSGKPHHSGNVSLLWMRREAVACGLMLEPTSKVWVPDDVDLGISDSMTRIWQLIEYMPITHQVSFGGGADDNQRRWHRQQPRRIIPGQKVHASVLYANSYKPRASLGEGLDIPLVHAELETELDSQLWETGLFDNTAAQRLLTCLGAPQGVSPTYLGRLLFMLRFEEGKRHFRNTPDWSKQLLDLINNPNCASLVKLVTIVAYYEVSCDPNEPGENPSLDLPQKIFNDAKNGLVDILAAHEHRYGPVVVALLRPMTKHRILRERILKGVLQSLMELLDVIISGTGGSFVQAMEGLACLLQCDETQETIVEKLGTNLQSTNVARLSWILETKDPYFLNAALRMVVTLARIPQARRVCSLAKPRLRELAQKDQQLIGLLSVEILLVLYDPTEQEYLNIRNPNVRANLLGALVSLSPDKRDPIAEEGYDVDLEQHVIHQLLGVDATKLTEKQKKLIKELKRIVWNGNAWERATATLTLLKLCKSELIRSFLCEINLLAVFVNQMKHKDKALLAAYAVATCLKHDNMKESIRTNELLKNIVGMLRHDYFDDAVGQVEGFQIFRDLIHDGDLREGIKNYNVTEVLNTKLAKENTRETRTSLICLDVLRSMDENGPWTEDLVRRSLESLRKPDWKAQKTGVIILSALAQTEHGVAAIKPRVHEIVEMLLPIPSTMQGTSAASEPSPGDPEAQTQPAAHDVTHQIPTATASRNAPPSSRPPYWMMGPAWALCILAQNEQLRNTTRSTSQYSRLKHLYLVGTLVGKTDTRPWRTYTPNRADVVDVIDKMIKAVDEELSEEGLMSIGDVILPRVKHWDRFRQSLGHGAVAAVTFLPALLGVVVVTPVASSIRALQSQVAHYRSRVSESLSMMVHTPRDCTPGVREAAQPVRKAKSDSGRVPSYLE